MQRDNHPTKTNNRALPSTTVQKQGNEVEQMKAEAQIITAIENASHVFDDLTFSQSKEEILANAIRLYKCCNLILNQTDLDALPINIKNEIATKIVFYLGYANYITFCISKNAGDFNHAQQYFCDAERSGYVEAKLMLIIMLQEQSKMEPNKSEENEKRKKELLLELIHDTSKDGLKLPIQDKTELLKFIFNYLHELKNENNTDMIRNFLAFLDLIYKTIPCTDYDYGHFYIEYGKILEKFGSAKEKKFTALLYLRAFMQWQDSGLELLIEFFKDNPETTKIREIIKKLQKIEKEKLYNKDTIIILEEIIHALDRYFNNQKSKPDSRAIAEVRLTFVDFLIAQAYSEDCPYNYAVLEKANELLSSINTDSSYKKILKKDLEEQLSRQSVLGNKKKSEKSKNKQGNKKKKTKIKVGEVQAVSQQKKTIKRTARKHDQNVSSASAEIKQEQRSQQSSKKNPKPKSTKKKKNQKRNSQQRFKKKQDSKKADEEVQVKKLGVHSLEKPLILMKSDEIDDEKLQQTVSELSLRHKEISESDEPEVKVDDIEAQEIACGQLDEFAENFAENQMPEVAITFIDDEEDEAEEIIEKFDHLDVTEKEKAKEVSIESNETPIQLNTQIKNLLNNLMAKYAVAFLVGSQVRDRYQFANTEDLEARLANHDIDLVVPLPKEPLDEVLMIDGIEFHRKTIDTKRVIYENKKLNIQIYFSQYLNQDPQSIITDADKRDFTVNALYADINGKLYDPTGRGIRDLKAKMPLTVTKLPYDLASMGKDPIRIFRLLHLYVQGYKKTYPPSDLSKIYEYLNKKYERINDDQLYYRLDKHFMSGQAVASLDLLLEYNLINYVFPGIRGKGLAWLRTQLFEADKRVEEGFRLSHPRIYMNFLAARIISEVCNGKIRHIDQIDCALIKKLMKQFRFPKKLKEKIKNYVSKDIESYIKFIQQQASAFSPQSSVLTGRVMSQTLHRRSAQELVTHCPEPQPVYLTPPVSHHQQQFAGYQSNDIHFLSIHQEYEHRVREAQPCTSGPTFVQVPPAPVVLRRPLPAAPISLGSVQNRQVPMSSVSPRFITTNDVRYPFSPSYREQKGKEVSQNPFSLFSYPRVENKKEAIPAAPQHPLFKSNVKE